jgi:hypothetical protein
LLAFPADPTSTADAERTAGVVGLARGYVGVSCHQVGAAPLPDSDGRLRSMFGVASGAIVLIRPDGYIGFRGRADDETALKTYLSSTFA